MTHPSASASTQAPAPAPEKPAPQPPYNVLFLMIDAWRADMPWAGYPRDVVPRLSAFAKRSTLYPRGYALSSYTAKSVAPMLAGLYGSEMKRDGYFFTRWTEDNVFITELLSAKGHATLAGNGHGYFLPGTGMNQGFTDYRLLPGTFLDTKGVFDVTSDRLNALAKEMLSVPKNVSQDKGHRFFAYFHFLDPHFEYYMHDGHPDWGKTGRDRYDNEVHYTDHWVGDLIDWVEHQSWAKQTAIIVTGDHGEGFGEHNQYRHAYQVWESLVRVPLIIHVPGAPPRRIDVPRSHIDLAPTIAELMGLEPQPNWRGKSLVSEVFGDAPKTRPVISELPRCDLMDRRRALIDGDYKLISFGNDWTYQMYKVSDDYREERELSKAEPERFASMKKLYLELSAKIPNEPVVGGAPLKDAPPGQRW